MPEAILQLTADIAVSAAQQFGITQALARDVRLNVWYEDAMARNKTADHYLGVGASALAAIQSVVTMWGSSRFQTVLDFGCGHGRVLRWLRAAWPEAHIVAADIDENAVAFCADTFGAAPWISAADVSQLSTNLRYDLIWVGSVITHLPPRSSLLLIDRVISWLEPGGIAVLSSHGRTAIGIHGGGRDCTAAENLSAAVRQYRQAGYGYCDYPNSKGYGTSFASPGWFWRMLSADDRIGSISVTEWAWDRHHDIVAFIRNDILDSDCKTTVLTGKAARRVSAIRDFFR